MNLQQLVGLLQKQVKPANGCTEPAAIALVAARARREVGGQILGLRVRTSVNIYKNSYAVHLPGTARTGVDIAAALGAAGGDSGLGLQVLSGVSIWNAEAAEKLVDQGLVETGYETEQDGFYIEVVLTTTEGQCRVVAEDGHTNITLVEVDGETRFANPPVRSGGAHEILPPDITFRELREAVEAFAFEDIAFLLEGVDMNEAMADYGLAHPSGMGLGMGLARLSEEGLLPDDVVTRARVRAAAAADARMSGADLPVMTSAGSGNHGIEATLPVAVFAREKGESEERLARALALSHLTNILIKQHTGLLSAACGCTIAAGTGSAVGIAWLLGSTDPQIAGAVKNMAGNLSGMVCDGAKGGCALKLATGAAAAIESALLARQNVVISSTDGIVGESAEATVRNLGKLFFEGLAGADETMMEIMLAKHVRQGEESEERSGARSSNSQRA